MDSEILQACIKGDLNARKQLIESNYGSFMAICRRYAKNNSQAEIFFHAAFMDVFRQMPSYRNGSSFDEWLSECFLSGIILQLKNSKAEYYVTTTTRVEEKKSETSLFDQDENDLNSLPTEDYLFALQQLPASFRAIYNMHVVEEFSFDKISALLEISEYSARNSFDRARNQFAKNIQSRITGHA